MNHILFKETVDKDLDEVNDDTGDIEVSVHCDCSEITLLFLS